MTNTIVKWLAMASLLFIASPASAQPEQTALLNRLYSEGVAAIEEGNYALARRSIQRVVEMIPFEPSSRILFARCQAALGDLDGARNSLERASQLGWEDAASVADHSELEDVIKQPDWKRILAVMEQNRARPFLLHVGKGVDRSKAVPLILLFHGRGELPHIQVHFWKEAADRGGWLLLAPKGTRNLGGVYAWESAGARRTWQLNETALLDQTRAQLKQVTSDYKTSELVLAGFSQGGVAALQVLRSKIKPRPIGAVLFAAAFPNDPVALFNQASLPRMRVVAHVGAHDRWLTGNQAVVKHLEQSGSDARLKVWKGIGHEMPPNHTRVILDAVNELFEQSAAELKSQSTPKVKSGPGPGCPR